jgi:hypothetical protein
MNWTVLRNTKGKHICEEFFTILNHKGNPNQNSTEILSHPSQNGYQIKTKQQILARMYVGEREPLYAVDGNVN